MFAPRVATTQTRGDAGSTDRFGQRTSRQAGNERDGDHEREIVREDLTDLPPPRHLAWDFGKIPLFPPDAASRSQASYPLPGIIQRKLAVGAVDDPLEHEADRVAGQVMRMPDPDVSVAAAPPPVSRKCAAYEEEKTLRTKPTLSADAAAGLDVETAVRATERGGEPLPGALRSYFEPRFGRDLSQVRVHADSEAATAARAVQARAYTISRDIVFGTGEYAPGTEAGKQLLAHELTHVVQQSARGPAAPRLRRFTSAEHKSLGDQAATGMLSDINIGTDAVPDYLTFGDVVALAADYFGSLEEMRSLASTEAGRAKLRWVYWWALGKAQGKSEPPLDDTGKQAIKDRYFTLASQNVSHFSAGGTAGDTYKDQHTKALRAAFDAGSDAAMTGKQPDLTPARTQEAFAQHYLSDMFSAGHVRTERAAIKAWYDANMPQSIPQFVAYMAKKMHDYLVNKHPVVDVTGEIPVLDKIARIPSEAELQQRIKTIGGAAFQAFSLGDIVSLGYHNFDSMGLDVKSEADESGKLVPGGSSWRAMGDAMLSQSPTTRGMAVAAMRASLNELDVMAKSGMTAPRGVLLDGGFGQALSALGDFAAWKFVPQAAATNHPMKWMWGFFNQRMYDAVDAAVKEDIVKQLNEKVAEQTDQNVRDALADFSSLLEILGIVALEQAVGEPAKQKRYPLPGMYGYQPPGPDD